MEEGAYGLEQCMLFARSDNRMIWHSLKWLKSDWLAVTGWLWLQWADIQEMLVLSYMTGWHLQIKF